MNDRFKFRAWDLLLKKYIYDIQDVGCDFSIRCNEDCFGDFLSGNHIVEQCTGLKDKNGRLIYEGDIVKRLFFNDRRKNKMKNCVIKWCNGRAVFTLDADMRDDYRSYEANCDNVFKECEVIGNIHENHDLVGTQVSLAKEEQ